MNLFDNFSLFCCQRLKSFNIRFKEFKEKLSIIDLFGQKIDLTYKKEVYFRTYYGAVYTLFIFIIIILQIVAGYKDMTSRLNPIINRLEIEPNYPEKINLINDSMTLAFAINTQDRKQHYVNPNIINFEGKIISRSKNDTLDTVKSHRYDFENCTRAKFDQFENFYNNFSLSQALCLKKKDNSTESDDIFSIPQEFTESYFKLKIRICENKALYVKDCILSKDFIDKILPSLYLNIYVFHQFFDGIDVANPIKPRLSFITFSLHEELFLKKKYSLFLTKNFLTDYNDLYSSFVEPETKSFIGFSLKDVENTVKLDLDDKVNFVEIYFRLDNIPKKFTRKYNTYFDLLATIGGLFNALFIIGMIIFGLINKILLDTKIINDHFKIYGSDHSDFILSKNKNFIFSGAENIFLKENSFNDSKKYKNRHSLEKDIPSNDLNLKQKEIFLRKLKKDSIPDQNIKSQEENINIPNNQTDEKNIEMKKHKNLIKISNDDILQNKESNEEFDNRVSKFSEIYSVKCIFLRDDVNNYNKETNPIFKPITTNNPCNQSDQKNEKDITQFSKLFKFKYGIKDILKTMFFIPKGKQEKKFEIYDLCRKITDNYMDVNELIPLIQEFRVIKSLLFNKSQLEIINYYKKPIIKVSENESKIIFRKIDIDRDSIKNHNVIENNLKLLNNDKNNLISNEFDNQNFNYIFNNKVIELCNLEMK